MTKSKANPNINDLLNKIIDSCTTKNAKKGLKWLSKTADLSYMGALPSLASEVIIRKNLLNDGKQEINILIHASLSHDCVDHYRWFALIPFLVGKLDLKINVVAITADNNTDTLTQFRNVIDFIIVKEIGDRFSSELVQGDLSSVVDNYGEDYFDLVINNIPSSKDLSNQKDNEVIKKLIDKGVPYVLSDISRVTLLNRYNMFKLVGYGSTGDVWINIHGLNFSKKLSTVYQHCGHYIILDEVNEVLDSVQVQLDAFIHMEKPIVSRLEHGDRLNKTPFKTEDNITIFEGVIYNENTGNVRLAYLGDNYRLKINNYPMFPLRFENQSDLDFQSDLVYWGINLYTQILNELSVKQGEIA